MGLKEELSRELSRNTSMAVIKANLINRGYLEEDIDKELGRRIDIKSKDSDRNNALFGWKEFIDRIGYGFASQQFINILFMLSGAPLFLIGLISGVKATITYLLSGMLKEYSKIRYFGKAFISTSGIIYGFSFLGMASAVVIRSPILFTVSTLIGCIGIIAHGDLYTKFHTTILKSEHRKTFLRFISYFGILITAISILLAALLMEAIPVTGRLISPGLEWLGITSLKVYGYLLAFEITAIMFILSGYLMSFIQEKSESLYSSTYFTSFLKQYFDNARENSRIFIKNRKILLLTAAAIIFTIIQIILNSYTGIFIYQHFKSQFLGGFMNVAVIFVIALLASISGTILTKKFSKSLGEAPMLVFGTLLVALLPLTLYLNPNLYAIGLATALSVIGGAVVGVAQGLIAERLMDDKEINSYFTTLGFISIIPTLVLVIIGAIIAQTYTLQTLFLILGIILAAIVMPIYFILVLIIDAEYRKEHRR